MKWNKEIVRCVDFEDRDNWYTDHYLYRKKEDAEKRTKQEIDSYILEEYWSSFCIDDHDRIETDNKEYLEDYMSRVFICFYPLELN